MCPNSPLVSKSSPEHRKKSNQVVIRAMSVGQPCKVIPMTAALEAAAMCRNLPLHELSRMDLLTGTTRRLSTQVDLLMLLSSLMDKGIYKLLRLSDIEAIDGGDYLLEVIAE